MKRVPLEHRLFGALLLELRGEDVASVVRTLQRGGVELHDVRPRGSTCTLRLALGDFPECYRACRRHRVKIRFLEKSGLPFALRRAARRKMMLAGPLLFTAVLFVLSSLIWNVRVEGTTDEDTLRQVLAAARETGLYRGALKWSLPDVAELQERILDRMPSLVWVGVQVEGGKAKLEILPKIPGPQPSNAVPCNIVAAKPGVITRVFADRGEVTVKAGQVVQPGQVLISGYLGDSGVRVAAAGKVFAEVWYKSDVIVPLQVTQRMLTGNAVRRYYLVAGPVALHVWGWQQPHFADDVIVADETDWRLFGWRLPVQWRIAHIQEVSSYAIARSVQQARTAGLRLAAQDVLTHARAQAQILGQAVLHSKVEHGKLYETVLTRVEEDIGTAAPLSPNLGTGHKAGVD